MTLFRVHTDFMIAVDVVQWDLKWNCIAFSGPAVVQKVCFSDPRKKVTFGGPTATFNIVSCTIKNSASQFLFFEKNN